MVESYVKILLYSTYALYVIVNYIIVHKKLW